MRQPSRPLTDKDRAFLAKHRQLAKEDERPARGSGAAIEVAGEVRRETDAAFLFFDGTREVWVPKSQVTEGNGGLIMPEWLAKDKGLI